MSLPKVSILVVPVAVSPLKTLQNSLELNVKPGVFNPSALSMDLVGGFLAIGAGGAAG